MLLDLYVGLVEMKEPQGNLRIRKDRFVSQLDKSHGLSCLQVTQNLIFKEMYILFLFQPKTEPRKLTSRANFTKPNKTILH